MGHRARSAIVTLVSDVTQTLTFVCRRGIASLSSSAPMLTAGVRTRIGVGLLTGDSRLINRASGKVLDVADGSTANGAPVIRRTCGPRHVVTPPPGPPAPTVEAVGGGGWGQELVVGMISEP
ncbi:RICIN domain-containing protein [Streptomyces sp. NPDC047014]|uniref:RICIN domain-containing protein n=1 Tax=Streptomyces sp. NPDC047014 TaxID=3155736 RepID=UPI0033E4B006